MILFLQSTSRSHGWRIDTDEQDAHEMLHVLLTSLEEEAQKSHDSAASRTASLSFYDCIIGNTVYQSIIGNTVHEKSDHKSIQLK